MSLEINKEFAKELRELEEKAELRNLKDKYNDDDDDDDSDSESESEDDEAKAVNNHFEKDFYGLLDALKRKDPKLYDPRVNFFKDGEAGGSGQQKKKTKAEKPLSVRAYEGIRILEKKGKEENSSDEEGTGEDDEDEPKTLNTRKKEILGCFEALIKKSKSENGKVFVQETQEKTKKIVNKKKSSDDDDDDDDDDEGKEEMKGKKDKDSNDQPGKSYWEKSGFDSKDKFLRDFFLNKKYISTVDDKTNMNELLEEAEEDEEEMEKEEIFEHKYNFRFEDPDAEFVKSYPRTIADSVRMKVNKRVEHRKAVETRKQQEKAKKKDELRLLRKLKKKEEMKKLRKLKRISGAEMNLDDVNLEGDFSANQHDEMMKKYFGRGYYDEYDAEDVTRPEEKFLGSDNDQDDWDNWTGVDGNEMEQECNEVRNESKNDKSKKVSSAGEKKDSKKHRKSKFAEILSKSRSKPAFNPDDQSFEDYLDMHYNVHFEDMIDGQTCRFRYRNVYMTDYGLTTDEILKAPDQELNEWVSLKHLSGCRTEEEEAWHERAMMKKFKKKKKVLKSLYETPGENDESASGKVENKDTEIENQEKKKEVTKETNSSNQVNKTPNKSSTKKNNSMKKRKRKRNESGPEMTDERLEAYNIQPKKFKYYYNPMVRNKDKKDKIEDKQ